MDELVELKELGLHYARGIWKNRWIAIAIAWVVLLLGVAGVDQIKNRYQAETKVYIDSTSVLGPLLRGLAVQSDFQAVVELMVKQLLSRPNLERAVRILDLDLDVNSPLEMEELISSVRKRVSITAQKRSGIYTINYTDIDRRRARQMVQTLLDIFVEDTLGSTINQSDTAIEFLDQQIEKYETLLLEAEKRREDFKRKNIGMMPQDGSDYFRQLQDSLSTLEQAQLVLSELRNRRDRIQQQITELQNSEVRSETVVKTGLDARIAEQEKGLDEMLLLYTEEHPDVINARQVLSQLRERKAQEAEQTVSSSSLYDNPVYQELQIAMGKTEADISSVNTRVLSLKRKSEELRERIDIVPQIEADLQRLNRDYEVHRKNYNELVSRREQARISDEAESGGEQVKFRIIEPPYVPFQPEFPNRPLLDFGVLLAAIAIGYGLSLLISLLQPVFYNQKDLMKYIGGSVLGGINKFDTPRVLSKRRRNVILFGVANLLFVSAGGVLIYLHYEGTLILSRLHQMVM
jgi:polysaccharide chain length determinant protein (PEP-CTERM system associated)